MQTNANDQLVMAQFGFSLRNLENQFDYERLKEKLMEGPLRGCLAGAAAWKWGGGCLSTIVIFIIVYILLGHVKC